MQMKGSSGREKKKKERAREKKVEIRELNDLLHISLPFCLAGEDFPLPLISPDI